MKFSYRNVQWLLLATCIASVHAAPSGHKGEFEDNLLVGSTSPEESNEKAGIATSVGEQQLPVCIIGAGPAGLTAAKTLEDNGRRAVIFEKQPEVGGKCQSFYDEVGQYHPMGALLFSNATYEQFLPVVDDSGVRAEAIIANGGDRPSYDYNVRTGRVTRNKDLNFAAQGLLDLEVKRYTKWWNENFKPYYSVGYKNGVPEQFTISTKQWLQSHYYAALQVVFIKGMVLYGYGDLREIPVLYMLQYITPDILEFFVGKHEGYLIDFHKVWVQWAEKMIKSPIHTLTTVVDIDRSSTNPVVTYRGTYSETAPTKKQHCSSVILAFPPTLENFEKTGLDVSEKEHSLFKAVTTEHYYSGAARVRYPGNVAINANQQSLFTPPVAEGQVVLSITLFKDSQITTAYSWDSSTDPKLHSYEEARAAMRDSLSSFNVKNPDKEYDVPTPLKDEDLLMFRMWDYFPRVNGQELRDGFYKKFAKLQGHQKTYYASGLNGFEMVEYALIAGREVVQDYLLKQS